MRVRRYIKIKKSFTCQCGNFGSNNFRARKAKGVKGKELLRF